MIFFEDLIPLRLYSNKKRVYAPINEKDKKNRAAIFLMGTSQDQNEKMMNAPFLYMPKNLFRAYYIDRNVMTYINSDAKKEIEGEEEFDELKEAVLSEGMMHTGKTKFTFDNASTMDERILKNILNKDSLDHCLQMLAIKESPIESFNIIVHPNIGSLKDSYPGDSKDQFYSFTSKNNIHLLSYYVYNEKTMDGPYNLYCKHELIYCILINQYPEINRTIARCVAMALSGQIEYLRNEKKKINFNYADSKKENIDGLYIADLIYQVYNHSRSRGINRILHGDFRDLRKIAGRRIIDSTRKLFESAFTEDSILSEGVLFSQKDYFYNMDEWKPNKKNILFIVGLSGSGKTTLSKEYALKNRAIIVNLDTFFAAYDIINENRHETIMDEIIHKYHKKVKKIDKHVKDMSTEEYRNFLKNIIKFAYHELKNSNYLYIFEGIQLIEFMYDDEFRDIIFKSPLIIKNTSLIQSIYRRYKRDKNIELADSTSILDSLFWYCDQEYGLKYFRKFADLYNESASIDDIHPAIEYADNGDLFGANYSLDYYAIQHIIKDFSKEEFDRISFHSTYKESEWIKKRIVLRDNNGTPMSFMDVYHFPSDPERAQITTAVSKAYRGHHLCSIMLEKLFESGFAAENGIKKYIWHVHPGNDTSEHIAQINGFKKGSEDLDKYGRYTYVYELAPSEGDTEIVLPSVSMESGYLLNESSAFIFNEFNEMNIKNNAKLKKYLYKERLKNAREVMTIYDQVKSRNPQITRTFRSLAMYKEMNLFVDTSYYHALYLKNVPRTGGKRILNMYFDFLCRLMIDDQYRNYTKTTYFFPVQYTRNGESLDDLLNYQKDLNPLSMIAYFAKKEPEMFNRWHGLNIVFIGDNGYFTVDFKDFNTNKFMKFRRNLSKLLSHEPIIDEDESDDISSIKSSKAVTSEIIDTIENNSRISITDISAVDNINISHLSYNDTLPRIIDNSDSSAIMILSPDSTSVISEINSKALKSNKVKVYYKPKI